jgi:hypothetical protein
LLESGTNRESLPPARSGERAELDRPRVADSSELAALRVFDNGQA